MENKCGGRTGEKRETHIERNSNEIGSRGYDQESQEDKTKDKPEVDAKPKSKPKTDHFPQIL